MAPNNTYAGGTGASMSGPVSPDQNPEALRGGAGGTGGPSGSPTGPGSDPAGVSVGKGSGQDSGGRDSGAEAGSNSSKGSSSGGSESGSDASAGKGLAEGGKNSAAEAAKSTPAGKAADSLGKTAEKAKALAKDAGLDAGGGAADKAGAAAAPALGAGGTDAKRDEKDSDGQVGKNKGSKMSGGTKAAGGAAAGAAMTPALFFMMLVQMLKTLFMQAMAMVMSLLQALAAAFIVLVNTVVGVVTGIGSAILGAVGVVAGAVTQAVTGTAVFSIIAAIVAAAATSAAASSTAQKDAPIFESCSTAVTSMQKQADPAGAGGNTDAQVEERAKKVYSILAGMGMPDVNIAGILGNWTTESGIDPTGVETIYDEPNQIGPRKSAAEAAGFKIAAMDAAYAAKYPAIDLAGIGLGQWTNGRNTLLMNYAKSINQPWHALETQIGFMISKDDPTRVAYIQEMMKTPAANPGEASSNFSLKWEGIRDHTFDKRQQQANDWYAKMSGWPKDKALADSILSQSNSAVVAANTQAVSNAVSNCRDGKAGFADNSSLAMAALSYAYPTEDEGAVFASNVFPPDPARGFPNGGTGNDGTPLYQELHKHIFPGDPYFQSCDRGVATAVRWSGTDDTFPAGATPTQLSYLQTSPKWKEVTDWGGDPSKLQPGDVLIRADDAVGHIVLYVGNENVQKVFAGRAAPDAVTVSASYGSRSPGAGAWYTGAKGLNTYHAFRSTGPEANSQYKSYVPTSAGMGGAQLPTGLVGKDPIAPPGYAPPGLNKFPVPNVPKEFFGPYAKGNCTWYVYARRKQIGKPVPTTLGNGGDWAANAKAQGLPTGAQPQVGAAYSTQNGGYGHIMFVEAVYTDGSFTVSEMNADYGPGSGFNIISTRLVKSANGTFIY